MVDEEAASERALLVFDPWDSDNGFYPGISLPVVIRKSGSSHVHMIGRHEVCAACATTSMAKGHRAPRVVFTNTTLTLPQVSSTSLPQSCHAI